MTLPARSVWALVVLTSCASTPSPVPDTPSVAASPVPASASSATGVSAANDEADAQRRVADFLLRVAAVRHLAPHASVEARVLDRPALIANVRQHVTREIPPDVIRNQGELLVGLGLVPPGFDYEEGAFRLLEAQLAGFYEPHDKKMYLASDLPGRAADATLAHELVHALQDQHYDLGSRLAYQSGDNDRESALQALAEGDATSAMMDLLLKDANRRAVDVPDDIFAAEVEGSVTGSDGAGAPRVLRASLVAPYVDGVMFVHALRRRGLAKSRARPSSGDDGGWSAVDEAWRSPPATTEQLLHIDKYEAHEPPEVVPVPPAPGPGWVVGYDDVFGEEGLRIAIEEWMPVSLAAAVARGWAGDRAALFCGIGGSPGAATTRTRRPDPGSTARGGAWAVAWQIRFDATPKDPDLEAREAFKALSEAVRPGRAASGSSVCVERATLGPLTVSRVGRDIAIVAGPYRHDGNRVVSDSLCAKSLRWAADILSKPRR